MIADQQTVWTLIPRGYFSGTKSALFTVYVSPWMGTIDPEPALIDTCWVTWFDQVSEVIKSNKSFLQLKAEDGVTTKLTLCEDLPYPQLTADVASETAKVLQLRKELWVALTQTNLPHVGPASLRTEHAMGRGTQPRTGVEHPQAPGKRQTQPTSQWDSDVISSNPIAVPANNLAAHAATLQKLARANDPHFVSGWRNRTAHKEKNSQALKSFALNLQNASQQGDLAKFEGAKAQLIDDARLTLGPGEQSDAALNDEIQQWINKETGLQSLAARTLKRDLFRLSSRPYDSLKPSVLLYLYQKRAQQENPRFKPAGKYESYQDEVVRKASFIEGVVFHRRISTTDSAFETIGPAIARVPVDALPTKGTGASAYLGYGDFLQVLAMLGHYPRLMYCLGLAFDVTADDVTWSSETGLSVGFAAGVADLLGATAAGKHPAVAVTHYVFPKDDPSPSAEPTLPLKNGFLQMDGYQACTYDADGDTLRQNANAESPAQVQDDSSIGIAEGLLPKRSAGIAIVHADHPMMLVNQVRSQLAKRKDSGSRLYAKDLVRGFSPEVLGDSGWISLTARAEDYKFKDKSLLGEMFDRPSTPINLEACFADDAAPGDTPVYDPHIGGALLRWPGWNMALPLPFVALSGPKEASPSEQTADYPIQPVYKPIGGFKNPRLRFGGQHYRTRKIGKYSIRIRGLDLVGNPIVAPPNTPNPSTLETDYLRHDPLPAPELLADPDFDPQVHFGEQMGVMAVRDGDAKYQPTRYMCPPVASLMSLIEQGAFDRNEIGIFETDTLLSPYKVGSFEDVLLNDKGDLYSKCVGDKTTGNQTHEDITVPVYLPPTTPMSGAYLPDLFAHFLNVQLQDVVTGRYFGPIPLASFYEEYDASGNVTERKWPRAVHLRTRLEPAPDYDPYNSSLYTRWELVKPSPLSRAHRLQLSVSIPKGWHVRMLVSCAPTADQLKRMDCDGDAGDLVANGLSPILTPTRSVLLVHAVSKPLADAYFQHSTPPQISHQIDSPVVGIAGSFQVGDGRSTGMCIVTMEWDEYIDNPAQNEPQKVSHSESLVQIPNCPIDELTSKRTLAEDDPIPVYFEHSLGIPGSTTYKFADGKYRQVCFGVTAVTRFQNFFGSSAKSPQVTQAIGSTYARKAAEDNPDVSVDKLNTQLPFPVNLSHILPLLPIVPAPKRTKVSTQGGNEYNVRSAGFRRYGGAFRIHLRRGWYSSGMGEQLGIMLVGDDHATCTVTQWEADPLLSQLFTRWGADPVWSADAVPSAFPATPLQVDFTPPDSVAGFDTPVAVSLRPHELQGPQSPLNPRLMTYNPVFTKTDGWYCDVIIRNVPARSTFLRLALVRYQPKSCSDREVSLVTLAPFIQVHSDCAVRIIRSQMKHQYSLAIYGLSSGVDAHGHSAMFQVIVERAHHELWECDQDAICKGCDSKDTNLPSTLDGESGGLPLLATYSIVIKQSFHHPRRVRVDEFEMRTGYDPLTLQDSSASPFWTNFGPPIPLP
jgi:hypothetical protein